MIFPQITNFNVLVSAMFMSTLSKRSKYSFSSKAWKPFIKTSQFSLRAFSSSTISPRSYSMNDMDVENSIANGSPEVCYTTTTPTSTKTQRDFICNEILSSEFSYGENLRHLTQVISPELKNLACIESNQVKNILGSATQLLALSDALVQDLQQSLKDNNTGAVLLRYAPCFNWFSAYSVDYSDRVQLLEEFKACSEQVPWLLNKIREKKPKTLCIEAILIIPIQRITRYPLLLQQLVENTPESHSDYHATVAALCAVEAAAKRVDEAVTQHENSKRLLAVHQALLKSRQTNFAILRWLNRQNKKVQVFDLQRRLVRYSDGVEVVAPNGTRYFCKVWVLNDKMIVQEFENAKLYEIIPVSIQADMNWLRLRITWNKNQKGSKQGELCFAFCAPAEIKEWEADIQGIVHFHVEPQSKEKEAAAIIASHSVHWWDEGTPDFKAQEYDGELERKPTQDWKGRNEVGISTTITMHTKTKEIACVTPLCSNLWEEEDFIGDGHPQDLHNHFSGCLRLPRGDDMFYNDEDEEEEAEEEEKDDDDENDSLRSWDSWDSWSSSDEAKLSLDVELRELRDQVQKQSPFSFKGANNSQVKINADLHSNMMIPCTKKASRFGISPDSVAASAFDLYWFATSLVVCGKHYQIHFTKAILHAISKCWKFLLPGHADEKEALMAMMVMMIMLWWFLFVA